MGVWSPFTSVLVSRGNNTSRTQHGPHFIVTLSTTYLNGIRSNKYPLSTILFYLHCITTVPDNGPVTGFMLESNLLIWLLPSFSKNNSPLFAKVVLDGGGVGEGVECGGWWQNIKTKEALIISADWNFGREKQKLIMELFTYFQSPLIRTLCLQHESCDSHENVNGSSQRTHMYLSLHIYISHLFPSVRYLGHGSWSWGFTLSPCRNIGWLQSGERDITIKWDCGGRIKCQ